MRAVHPKRRRLFVHLLAKCRKAFFYRILLHILCSLPLFSPLCHRAGASFKCEKRNGSFAKRKKTDTRATFHKKGIASKRPFSRNTSSKSHGRRQPCRGFSSRLATKIALFEVFYSFAGKIFSHTAVLRTQEDFVSFKAEGQGVGKKIRAKQNSVLRNAAQGVLLFFALKNSLFPFV
jgi:hypothetical protein